MREHGQDRLARLRGEEARVARVVVRHEVESGLIAVEWAGRIHESAWIDRRERRRQLDDAKRPDVRRDRHEMVALHEGDDLGGLALVVLEERGFGGERRLLVDGATRVRVAVTLPRR